MNGCVLELNDPPGDGNHVVASRRKLPPHDCQQWYLIDQSNDDTFMIVSKLNGRVLSSGNDQKECVLWRKDGAHIRSVSRKDYVLGIYGGHREPGYPVVLCGIRKDEDMSQQFDERPAVSLTCTIQYSIIRNSNIEKSKLLILYSTCKKMNMWNTFAMPYPIV